MTANYCACPVAYSGLHLKVMQETVTETLLKQPMKVTHLEQQLPADRLDASSSASQQTMLHRPSHSR